MSEAELTLEVPGRRAPLPGHREVKERRPLPVQAEVEVDSRRRLVRIRVRGERVVIERRVVVTEQVVVRTREVEGRIRVAATVARERLRVDPPVGYELAEAPPPGAAGGDLEWIRPDLRIRPRREDQAERR